MYQPPHFREDRIEVQHGLIRSHPLGLLITAGPGGLQANPIPFLVYSDLTKHGTLRAHMARGNPQWRELAAVEECLVVFQGPQQYITPSWYPTKQEHGKVVPTWNYAAVHAYGRLETVEDKDWLLAHVAELSDQLEAPYAAPWSTADAPANFLDALVRGIVGLKLSIQRLEGKLKMSQNRAAGDRAGVVEGLAQRGNGEDAIVASLVKRSTD
jgi:transcriptional regulator